MKYCIIVWLFFLSCFCISLGLGGFGMFYICCMVGKACFRLFKNFRYLFLACREEFVRVEEVFLAFCCL